VRGEVINIQESSLKKRTLWLEIKKNSEYYLLLAPFLILFTVFTVIPVILSLPIAFTNFNLVDVPRFIGFDNFKRLFLDDDVFLIAIKNTMVFSLITGPVSYFLCLFLAWLINEFPRWIRTILTLVFYVPSMTTSAYVIWTYIFSGDMYGLMNSTLMKIGIIYDPIQWLTDTRYNLKVVILVQIWLSLGAGFLSFVAGLQNIDKSMYESAATEGIRNRWQELIYITIPSMGPQLLFGAVMQISSSFAAGTVSMNLTGFPSTDYSTHTIITHAFDYGFIRYEMGYASAICLVLFVMMLWANKLIQTVLKIFTD